MAFDLADQHPCNGFCHTPTSLTMYSFPDITEAIMHPTTAAPFPSASPSKVAVQILSQSDDADDGADRPWSYTAQVVAGSVDEAAALLENQLGGSESLDAFNVEKDGMTLTFLAFSHADVGTVFSVNSTIESAKQQAMEQINITNELDRLITCAFMAQFPARPKYMRGYWWEHIHPDPDSPTRHDAYGVAIQVGQRCSYRCETTGEWCAGWVKSLSDRFERSVAVRDMDRRAFGARGCRPGDIIVIEDSADAGPVIAAIQQRIIDRREAKDSIGLCQLNTNQELRELVSTLLKASPVSITQAIEEEKARETFLAPVNHPIQGPQFGLQEVDYVGTIDSNHPPLEIATEMQTLFGKRIKRLNGFRMILIVIQLLMMIGSIFYVPADEAWRYTALAVFVLCCIGQLVLSNKLDKLAPRRY